jgi:alkanesulfonate monooxygenase SsuD/methylene tetrahydromethanopterin reductase-like flavin-dependent oxidoreductase (luciferase family)
MSFALVGLATGLGARYPRFAADNPSQVAGSYGGVAFMIAAVADSTEQARNEARGQIAFYYTTRLYHSILKPHGWEAAGEAIAGAFRRGDFKAMAAAVTDEMVDEIAIAGTPDEVRDQLKAWAPFADEVILYSPSVGMRPERVQDNVDAIVDTFASH